MAHRQSPTYSRLIDYESEGVGSIALIEIIHYNETYMEKMGKMKFFFSFFSQKFN